MVPCGAVGTVPAGSTWRTQEDPGRSGGPNALSVFAAVSRCWMDGEVIASLEDRLAERRGGDDMHRLSVVLATLAVGIPGEVYAQASGRDQIPARRLVAVEFGVSGLARDTLGGDGIALETLPLLAETPVEPVTWRGGRDGGGFVQAGTSTRSPAVAAGLSFVLPFVGINGVGSYYAGHPGHGTRHLLIGFASAGLLVAGVALCVHGCDGEVLVEGAMLMGLSAYVVNWGWGTVTAANDAKAYNRRQRETQAARFEPGFEVLAPSSVMVGAEFQRPRLGLRLVRLAF